jgi:hypothetical protein
MPLSIITKEAWNKPIPHKRFWRTQVMKRKLHAIQREVFLTAHNL